MNQKFWLCLCLIFSIFNLKNLIDDYDLINYIILGKDSKHYDDITNYLLCTQFEEIQKSNQSTRTGEIRNVSTILNYWISNIEESLNVKNLFKLDETFLFRDQFCFLTEKSNFEYESFLDQYFRNYKTQIFIFSKGKKPYHYEYILYAPNTDGKVYLRVEKQKIYGQEYLLNPKCFKFDYQFANSTYNCLNNCLIRFNHFYGFYSIEDTGNFNFSSSLNETPKEKRLNKFKNFENSAPEIQFFKSKIERKKFDKNLEVCLETCKQIKDCYLETCKVAFIKESYYKKIISKESLDKVFLESTLYKAKYSTTDFWLQFFGLLTLFTNTSLVSLASFLVLLFAKKIKKDQHRCFALVFPKFKIFLIIFSLFFVLIQSVLMYQEYRFKLAYPDKTRVSKFTTGFEPFSIVICLPVETIIYNDTIEKNRNNKIISSKTFAEIRSETDNALDKKINRIDFYYGFKSVPYEWRKKLSKKIIFKDVKFDNQSCLSRCFLIKIEIQETRYLELLSTNSLTIRFETRFWEFYLIDKDRSFESHTNYFNGEFHISKFKRENQLGSKKSNCMHYEEKSELNCRTKRNCIDKCINELYIKKYSNLSLHSVIEINDLNSSFNSLYFKDQRDSDIESKCNKVYHKADCIEIYFYESLQSTYYYDEKQVSINLNFEKIIEKELEQSWVKLMLNIINLESIFFGSNVTSLLLGLFVYFQKLFKFKYRSYRLIIFFVCFIGFIIHNTSTFISIIQNPLIDNGYFEKLENFYLINPIFCFQIDQKMINKNHKLTGNYLNSLTKNELNYDKIFETVWYYNKTNRNYFRPKATENQNSEIFMTHFYYLNLKCFEFNLNVTFNEEDLYFVKNKHLLRIYFKYNFTNQYNELYFLFRRNSESKRFTNNFYFKFNETVNSTYMIEFENYRVEHDDKFEILKNLKRLFIEKTNINDATTYLDNLIRKFNRNYRLTTTEILLESYEKGTYDLEIDNSLFEQFYLQIQNFSDYKYPSSQNSRQNFYNAYLKHSESKKRGNRVELSLLMVKRESKTTNDDNYTKLIQQIINSLSLWLNISILEIYIYLNKIPKLNVFSRLNHSNRIYRILIRSKIYFKNKLHNF